MTHPGGQLCAGAGAVHMNHAAVAAPFVGNEDLCVGLHDVEWQWHVGLSWNAGHEALYRRIPLVPFLTLSIALGGSALVVGDAPLRHIVLACWDTTPTRQPGPWSDLSARYRLPGSSALFPRLARGRSDRAELMRRIASLRWRSLVVTAMCIEKSCDRGLVSSCLLLRLVRGCTGPGGAHK